MFVKHDVTQEEDVRDFQDRLFSSVSNITELIFVTSYVSYWIQNICPWKNILSIRKPQS